MEIISIRENGIVFEVLAQPGSKTTCIEGSQDNRLKVRLAARAIDGAANTKLREFLSKSLQVSKSSVTLLSGGKSRVKTLFVLGDANKLSALLHKLVEDQGASR